MIVNKVFVLILFTVFLIQIVNCVHDQSYVVNTKLGQIRGVPADDGDYINFLGIPFAKVKEENPFGEAIPYPKFDDIFEANDDSAKCPQKIEYNQTIHGTLDCLHLNIHVPNSANATKRLPVFVWIFGGKFQFGFFGRYIYGPKFLVRHDIILITINYRVGPYGFMCLDIPEIPGNQGLKDQLMALRWIRDNIVEFGGDPDKITIGGNSSGSMCVEFHILNRKYEKSKVFHQAILQSGTVNMLDFVASTPFNKDVPMRMARHLGFETYDLYKAIEFLARVDPLVIIQATLDLNLKFMPCIENNFEGVESFITEDLKVMSNVTMAKKMPFMLGITNDEAGVYAAINVSDLGQLIFDLVLATEFNPQHPDFGFVSENIRNFYFNDKIIDNDQIRELTDYMGDLVLVRPVFRSLERLIDNGGIIYLYQFSYDGRRNFVKGLRNLTVGRAHHGDELGYLFNISYMEEPNDDEQRVIDSMTAMWANFVKYADPTPQPSELLPYKWEAITKGSPQHYMDIDLELKVGSRPFQKRMAYLDLVYHTLGKNQGIVARNVFSPLMEAIQSKKVQAFLDSLGILGGKKRG